VVFVPSLTPPDSGNGMDPLVGLFLTLMPQDASAAKRAVPIYPGAVLQCDLAARICSLDGACLPNSF